MKLKELLLYNIPVECVHDLNHKIPSNTYRSETPHKLARIFLIAMITRGKKNENSSDGSVTIEMKAEYSAGSWIGSIYWNKHC